MGGTSVSSRLTSIPEPVASIPKSFASRVREERSELVDERTTSDSPVEILAILSSESSKFDSEGVRPYALRKAESK